ncbi:MAG: hypothetical protein SH850_25505, partial [Planctomycetaceae bacterium]|nr:hypothetical protein [Planctomycetaceae bacterium]
ADETHAADLQQLAPSQRRMIGVVTTSAVQGMDHGFQMLLYFLAEILFWAAYVVSFPQPVKE